MTSIAFGTDGWRGVIAEDFTFANARIVAQAIARYVVRGEDARKGVIIGYDHRFTSDRIAAAGTASSTRRATAAARCLRSSPSSKKNSKVYYMAACRPSRRGKA